MSTAQRSRGRSVPASELEALGKQASRLGTTSGLSLTEACVRTLEPEALNAEQIRRVVEHCNINAVNSKFASLRGPNRVVHIDGGPADPVTVMDALNATTSAPRAQLVALEYHSAPPAEKRASVALPDRPRENIPALARKLAQAHEELVDICTGVEFRLEQRLEELKTAALRAANEGASLSDLVAAWAGMNAPLAKVAADCLHDRIAWGTKVASRSIHPAHTVMTKFAQFAAAALEMDQAIHARRAVETELAKVSRFLDSQAS